MPSNVEIKAEAANWIRQIEIASEMGIFCGCLRQRDTFFRVTDARLKLREQSRVDGGEQGARLIFYQREDAAAPTRSLYQSVVVGDARGMRQILAGALGMLVTVSKTRELYMVGRTRIHFDRVCRLGRFIEIEHPLEDHEDQSAGRVVVENLMQTLGIAPGDLVSAAYADLLMNR